MNDKFFSGYLGIKLMAIAAKIQNSTNMFSSSQEFISALECMCKIASKCEIKRLEMSFKMYMNSLNNNSNNSESNNVEKRKHKEISTPDNKEDKPVKKKKSGIQKKSIITLN